MYRGSNQKWRDKGMRATKESINNFIKDPFEFACMGTVIAADLLEARELIKEMREQLLAVVSTASTPTTKGESVYINNYIEMRAVLEKTKEHAE